MRMAAAPALPSRRFDTCFPAQGLASSCGLRNKAGMIPDTTSSRPDIAQPQILCIGAILWDIIGRTPRTMHLGADVPGRIKRLPGGVAMNIAMTLRRLGLRPALLGAVGRDSDGEEMIASCQRLGIETGYIYRPDDLPTDIYMAIEDTNGLIAAISDAHSLEAAGERILAPLTDGRLGSEARPWHGIVALDGNLTLDLLTRIAASPLFARADLRVAPASPGKAERLAPFLGHAGVTLYLNLEEAGLIAGHGFDTAPEAAAGLLARGASRVLVTDGSRSAADGCRRGGVIETTPPKVTLKCVTGAGDTFMAAHIVAESRGEDRDAALMAAVRAAATHVAGESQ
jgi:sugar/nucleoside kinase (ribokinase family)